MTVNTEQTKHKR